MFQIPFLIANVAPWRPVSATGGTISAITVAGREYRVHRFTSGITNFVVTDPGTDSSVEYLIVAGGGGGASIIYDPSFPQFVTYPGSGGGGEVLQGSTAVTPSTYPVVVGLGGAGGVDTAPGADGSPSSVFGISARGGGGGRSLHNETFTYDGAAGSRAAIQSAFSFQPTLLGNVSNSGRGHDGVQANRDVAGAGGAGGDGFNGGGDGVGGNGGPGVLSDITGTSTGYGGGAGGFGLNGGGASGSGGGAGRSYHLLVGNGGAVNTGGGASGGTTLSGTGGGTGGSGVVIIRYPIT